MVPLEVHELSLAIAACGLLTLICMVLLDSRRMLRPSVAVAAMQLCFVAPGAVLAAETREGSPIDEGLRIAACGAPLLLLLVAAATSGLDSQCTRLVTSCSGAVASPRERRAALAMSVVALALVGIVVLLLPWSQIGLVSLLTNPEESLEARAASLWALQVPSLKTIIGVFNRLAAPLCLGVLACLPLRGLRRCLVVPAALGPMLLLALNGARLQVVIGAVTLALGFAIRRWSLRGAVGFAAVIAVAGLTIGAATAARIGSGKTIMEVEERVTYRAVVKPFLAGVMHVEYAEAVGGWGPESYGFPLKGVLGFEHAEPSEVVGDWFAPGTGTLVTPPAVMDLMASFGVAAGMFVFVAFALLLDSIAGLLVRAPPAIAVGCLTALLVRSVDLVNTTIGGGTVAALFVLAVAVWFRRAPCAGRRPGACAIRAPN
jgi:hypothetical protein